MKKLLILLFSTALWAQNTTPNLGLTLPARGATNWDTQINGNFRLIDTAVGAQQNGAFVGAWSASTTYVKGQQVSSGGILYSSLQSNNTNNTPASSPAFWAVMVGGVVNPISLTGSPAQVGLTDGIGGRVWQMSVGRAAINAWDLFDATDGNELIWAGSSEVRIGSATNLPPGNSSRLYIFGGANGANVDVQASTTQTDQAVVELEGSDYATHSNSIRMEYQGINALGTTFGVTNVNLGEVLCGGTCANMAIGNVSAAPILFVTNNLERARLLNSYQLNLGVAGTGSGILGFNGSTSGTATLTAPAVAGTTTNPIVSSNAFQAPSLVNTSLVGVSSGNTVTLLNLQGPASAVTGTGSAVTLYTYTLPGNTLRVGTGFEVMVGASHSSGTASVTYTLTYGLCTLATNANTATGQGSTTIELYDIGATNTQKGMVTIAVGVFSNNVTNPSCSMDSTANNTITLQFTAAATEQVTPEIFRVRSVQ